MDTTIENRTISSTKIAGILATSALYVFFIADAINKVLLYLQFDFNRVSVFFRSFYEILFFAISLVFLTRPRIVFVVVTLLAFVFFVIGQKNFSAHIPYPYSFFENILIFNKYYFVFIIYFALYRLVDTRDQLMRVIDVLENIFLANSVAVIIGFVFQIGFLKTYLDQPYRYGFSGLIPAQNEATLFFFLSLTFFYYKHFILNQPSKKIWVVALSAVLLGTKGIYLFLVLLVFYHFLSNSSLKTRIVSIAFIVFMYFLVNWFLTTEIAATLLSYFVSQADKGGILTMVLSGRNITFETRVPLVMDYWSLTNFFFGGQDQTLHLIELDFVDMFLFLGIIGSIIYLMLNFQTIFSFSLLRPFNVFFVASYFGLATFGGHFFYSAVNALYLCLVCLFITSTQKPPPPPISEIKA